VLGLVSLLLLGFVFSSHLTDSCTNTLFSISEGQYTYHRHVSQESLELLDLYQTSQGTSPDLVSDLDILPALSDCTSLDSSTMSPWNVSQTPWSPHDWPMSPATNPYIPFQPLEDGSDASTWQLPSQAWNGFDATGWPIVTSDDVDAGTLSYLSQMDQNDRALSSFSGPQYCTSPSDVEAYFPSEQIWPTSCADSVLGSIVNCIPASGVAPLCVRDDCSGPMHYANPGHGAALALSPAQDHGLSMRASIARAQTIQAAVYRSDSCCSGVVEPTGQHMAPLHPPVRSVSHPVASHRQASTVAYQPAPFAFSPSYPGNRSLAFLPLALEDSLPADFGTSVPIKQEVQSPTHDHSCGPYGLDLAHPGLALPSDCRVFGPQTSMTATAGRPPLHVPEAAMAPMQHLGLDRMYHTGQIAEDDDGRHRTHPYYSRPAQADGRYHCPWKVQRSEDQCKHEPTKLKCNYEYEVS